MKNDRRKFLKKIVYTAPVIIALGSLATPAHAARGGIPGKPPKSKTATISIEDDTVTV